MTNAERVQKLQDATDNLINEFYQHTQDRLVGKERVSYSLNGRSFNWGDYSRQIQEMIKTNQELINLLSPGFSMAVVR